MIERAAMIKSCLEMYVKLPLMVGKISAKSWISKNAEKCQKNRNFEKRRKTYLGNSVTKKHTKFLHATPHRNGVMLGRLKCREEKEKKEKKNPILEPKNADFDKL